MDEDEKWFAQRLLDRSTSDGDIVSSIDALEVLLCVEALPSLVMFLVDASRPLALRERAAVAIRAIGSESVETQLRSLKQSREADLRHLADVALNRQSNK
jgi:hypothetical protein